MGTPLPTISIVVPNYNGGATIEETLRSLIEQNYPNLEIIVADGGSTDNSVDVIRRYEKHIAWWVSEKDRGQTHAINKGYARATGEIVNWLCSDDVLLPGALAEVGKAFAQNPSADVVVGACRYAYAGSRPDWVDTPTPLSVEVLPSINQIPQQSCFYRRSLLKRNPPLDEQFYFAMDFDLWNYFVTQGVRWHFLPDVLAEMRFSDTNKTTVGGVKVTREFEAIYKRYVKERIPLTYWHRLLRYPLERVRRRHRGLLFGLVYYPYQCTIILLLAPFYGFRRVRWMCWTEFG